MDTSEVSVEVKRCSRSEDNVELIRSVLFSQRSLADTMSFYEKGLLTNPFILLYERTTLCSGLLRIIHHLVIFGSYSQKVLCATDPCPEQ